MSTSVLILWLWRLTWIPFFPKRCHCNFAARRTHYSCLVSLIMAPELWPSFGHCELRRTLGFDSGVLSLGWEPSGKKEKGICAACGFCLTVLHGAAGIANL